MRRRLPRERRGVEGAGACALLCVCVGRGVGRGGVVGVGGRERGEERAASAPLAPCEGAAEPGAGTGPRWSEPRPLPPAPRPRWPLVRGGCVSPRRPAEGRLLSGCRRGAARRRTSGERAPAGRQAGRQEEPPPGEGLALGARLPGAGSGAMAAGRARRLLGSLWIALLLGQPDPAGAAARSGSQSLLTGKEPGETLTAAGGRRAPRGRRRRRRPRRRGLGGPGAVRERLGAMVGAGAWPRGSAGVVVVVVVGGSGAPSARRCRRPQGGERRRSAPLVRAGRSGRR